MFHIQKIMRTCCLVFSFVSGPMSANATDYHEFPVYQKSETFVIGACTEDGGFYAPAFKISPTMVYRTNQLKTQEAYQNFRQSALYQVETQIYPAWAEWMSEQTVTRIINKDINPGRFLLDLLEAFIAANYNEGEDLMVQPVLLGERRFSDFPYCSRSV